MSIAFMGQRTSLQPVFRRSLLLLLLTLVLPARLQAQNLIAVGFQNSQVQIYSMAPATGALTSLYATGAANAGAGELAYDPLGQRLFFQSSNPNRLYTVNLSTGVVSSVPIVGCCFWLEYDVPARRLLAVGFQNNQVQIFVLSPETGALTSLYSTGAPTAGSGELAFDPVGRRLFFQSSGPNRLYTVNVDTGAVSSVPIVGCCFWLQYDVGSSTLFAIGFQSNQVQIFSLNPQTGALTSLYATGAPNAGSGRTAFDVAGRRLFFQSSNPNRVYTVNVDTGAVSSAPIVGCCFFLQFAPAALATDAPTLTWTTLALLAICLLAAGVFRLHAA